MVSEERVSYRVDVDDIEGYQKKRRLNKEERLASVLEGREGRGKFGQPKEKVPGTSLTNKAKTRNQPFMLARQAKSVKAKRSLTTRQKQLVCASPPQKTGWE